MQFVVVLEHETLISIYGKPVDQSIYPANTQRCRNIVQMSLQHQDVAATLLRHCVFAG